MTHNSIKSLQRKVVSQNIFQSKNLYLHYIHHQKIMSVHSIHQYLNEVEKIIHFGGTKKETAIRNAFYNLLNDYAKQKGLMIIPEITIKAPSGKNVTPDGTLKDILRQDWGYWESKDESDDLDEEIRKKFEKGYPKDNILFEDSKTAVLIQNGIEVARVPVNEPDALHKLITAFISFERPEVKNFRKAIELFKQDIPKVTETIRSIIIEAERSNPKYIQAAEVFLKLCHDSINPAMTVENVREMIIQHILTEDIFNTIFDETQFHRENNIARQLESVIQTFFTGNIRRAALGNVQHYYQTINAAAAGIADHHEKQKFLKVVYETFYKSYNPKAADRLGVVYTPNEIVRFMIESTDYLLHKHFNKYLEDKDVEILDPATGTGTFVCDLIDYIRKEKLEYKYKNEIHANEVAILPYYISNLNIEFTYAQKMGKYSEFENLCFVDTLDNMGFSFRGKQGDLFSPFTEENSKRIKNQNSKKIAVIIGNPPYNANQQNENDNNKNREYPAIDKRIKDTFIQFSTAQKTKVYDMYIRFYRWAFDRLDHNGIIAFITNNSFINSRTFDGFRKCVQDEFQYAYIIDLGGNIRELSGKDGIFLNEKHTIFGQSAAVGIAMMFLVRNIDQKNGKCKIQYIHPTDIRATRDEKLAYISDHNFKEIPFENIRPDKNNNWINLAEENDWENMTAICSKNAKLSKGNETIFDWYSLGVATNRDEWVYDFDKYNLSNKMQYFSQTYNAFLKKKDVSWNGVIKWSRDLKNEFRRSRKSNFNDRLIIRSIYRPFTKIFHYTERLLNDVLTQNHYDIFGKALNNENTVLNINVNQKDIRILCSNLLSDLHFVGDSQCLPLYRYDSNGNRIENITDWGFEQFREHYKTSPASLPLLDKNGSPKDWGVEITKGAIFHYVYAVLHNPAYRKKYELNLKREFPRIPFYDDFGKWSAWGKKLMELHINYETVPAFGLQQLEIDTKPNPRAKLKADKENGSIILDENTTLTGIPASAWKYKLGNRSALEWILDQYKESTPKDTTIAEKFNTYKFADYKQQVIDLLDRVCTVSVETMKIVGEMENLN